jgi:hypothetical protein
VIWQHCSQDQTSLVVTLQPDIMLQNRVKNTIYATVLHLNTL